MTDATPVKRYFYSKLALFIIAVFFICERNFTQTQHDAALPVKVTTWDALGYYMYLPATIIYKDLRQLQFYDSIEHKYHLMGDRFYQFNKTDNGYYTGKYFVGIAVLQLPFFLIAHSLANIKDGFSLPYQYGIAYGAIIWVFISLIFFRNFLLQYFSDKVVAIGLLLAIIGTNALQYIAVEGAQSHAWIFPLYVYILILSASWHKHKTYLKSFVIGIVLGLAMMCRPTEGVMLFIPLLWNFDKKTFLSFIKNNLFHFTIVFIAMLITFSPQLYYWKYTTGHWIYDVGSKWDFFKPHFQVLTGEEKGWLVYTPLCVLFIIGLFFIKNKEYKVAVTTFIILNIWIVIAWHIWRYGGSYSARALMQSTPVMILPMLVIIEKILNAKYRVLWMTVFVYFLCLNVFQIFQYNYGVLHFDRNTWQYYKKVYWKTYVSEEARQYLQPEQ